MSAFKWLRGLVKDKRGNVLVIGAASMPLLIGAAGMAIDTTQLVLWKRQLQRAADSSAIAGAYAMGEGTSQSQSVANDIDEHIDYGLSQNEHPVLTDVAVASGSYADDAISNDTCAARAISPCFGRAVRVGLTSERTLPFLSIFTKTPTTIRADATAALVDEGEYCVVSLYGGTAPGITVAGTAAVNLGCGMATNARGPSAVTADGTSSVTASPIAAVGGIDGVNNNFVGDTTLLPYSAQQSDPLASLPQPPAQTCNTNYNVNPQESATMSPGCYRSLTIKGTVTLQPGTYYINGGDIDISSQAVVKGEGVTLVMTGTNGAAGDLKINGQAQIDLTASTSGDYEGVLFYRDRRASNIEIKINGGSGSRYRGALYFPSSDLSYEGGAGVSIECVQMIGQIVKFRGNATITNSCPAGSGASPFQNVVVRLVG